MSDGFSSGAISESLGSTSSTLLQRVKSGDAEAWRRVARLYGPIAFLWCRQSNLSVHDAADVVQETFLAVARHLPAFHRETPKDSFRGWLWTIVHNKIRDHFRRQRDSAQPRGGTAGEVALAQIPEREAQEPPTPFVAAGLLERLALDLIRAEFESRTWEAFWQVTVGGRSAAEVGDSLGMTKRAVRQAKYRVLRRLRQELADLMD